ncbi:hypothetical protein PR001_g25312 [Phytophthora rubi]|uniref:Reverse transcriptase domain-containing protein n=2 Tax=Phytophthora rubi TaxID=129364 RepID=A0A6A3I3Y6_9STRA|nr:hypothetical protein PR001_g25312 [Phytophthora rubi]
MVETALLLPIDAQPVRVVANFKGALNGLSRSDIHYVMSLPDSKFGRVAPYLDLIDGMAVQVTQNVATIKGVANGTLGTLEHVHFPPNTTFRLVRDGASRMVVRLSDRPPEYAILRVPRPHAVAIRAGVDPELFPVFFATEAYAKATISLPRAPNGQRWSVTVRPQQLPFVSAVGSTVYKVQGETLDSMVVIDWRSKLNMVNKPQQTYLLVSRVTSGHAFVALNPFTEELAAWSKPPASSLNEENRLNEMSNATLASIQGLSNAPATFNRLVTQLFRPMRQFVQTYFDEIFVHSRALEGKTDVEAHLGHLREVLLCMRENRLYANMNKCIFGAEEIPFLGCFLGKDSVRADPEKVCAIAQWPVPVSQKDLRKWLGLANYLHKYSANYAEMARPLTNLLKKDAVWSWTSEAQ